MGSEVEAQVEKSNKKWHSSRVTLSRTSYHNPKRREGKRAEGHQREYREKYLDLKNEIRVPSFNLMGLGAEGRGEKRRHHKQDTLGLQKPGGGETRRPLIRRVKEKATALG